MDRFQSSEERELVTKVKAAGKLINAPAWVLGGSA
jgi:hypothetical protein